jgi:geranylgeranyl pyrophosphate synthase/predicted secreted hydrolase
MIRPLHPELPHLESKVEWWFVHGRFAGPAVPERYFMFSLFRFKTPDADEQPVDAFAALLSMLDPRSGRQATSSRVDSRVLDALQRPATARAADPFSPDAVLEELRGCGLPREFQCPTETPVLESDRLEFRWADVVLAGEGGEFEAAFDEPGGGRRIHLRLSAATPRLWIDAPASVASADEGMEYFSFPRLRLEGCAGGASIEGDAWLDHQWGGSGWMQSADSPPSLRGWDWLGCNLDDGSDWVVCVHWDARSREIVAQYVTVRGASGETRLFDALEWQPLRRWTSPATRVRYPVDVRLSVPELDAELVFTSLADHQEVVVFGSQRAIWEGAGKVGGRVGGRQVEGRGRLEIQGAGYLFDLPGYLSGWAEMVDSDIAAFLPRTVEDRDVRRFAGPPEWAYEPASYTSMLAEPLWDLLRRDGKRWRAVFSFLLLDALGRDPGPVRDVGFILPELLHNASLIIDDIQDGALLRRGQESIHRRYGVDVAISAANTAYFLPMLAVLDHPVLTVEEKRRISEIYQRLLVRAHLGQSADLFWTHRLSEPQLYVWMADSIGPKILQMYTLKTAAPVEGLAEVAALLAQVPDATRDAVKRFALTLGLAFQLVDDVNNFSDSPGWGKERGEDLRTGKLTYVILRALRMLPREESDALRAILCRPELREDAGALRQGIELIVGCGACERVREEAHAMVLPAWEALSECVPPSLAKTELRVLWEGLMGSPFQNRSLPQ